MCPLKQLIILLLVYHINVQKPFVFGQCYPRTRLLSGEIKKFLRISEIKLQLPQRSIQDIKEFHPVSTITGLLSKFDTKLPSTEKGTSLNAPEIIKKHREFEEVKADCSDLLQLSCDEQRKLIESVFGGGKKNIDSKSLVQSSTTHDPEIVDSETTTNTYDLTTTEDDYYSLSERFHDAGLVATLIGG